MEGVVDYCPGNLSGASGQIFLNLINTLMAAQCALGTEKQYPPNYSPHLKNGDVFDYIVVGAGSAGSVVASRLSENGAMKVLLIEAGGLPSVVTEIPSLLTSAQNTKEDWAYRTEPTNTSCLGFKNRQCSWPRGKTLGGSSAINGMLYLRGNRRDYDTWVKLGNPGWDYDSVKPFFIKSEKTASSFLAASPNHGTKGLLTTTLIPFEHPIRKVLIEAMTEMGYAYKEDEANLGCFDVPNTIENGTRCSSSKAFISRIGRRDNLFVATDAQVSKVLIGDNQINENRNRNHHHKKGHNESRRRQKYVKISQKQSQGNNGQKIAIGVEVRIGDKLIQIKASKEVILSGGSINSPQILLNSGIGPKTQLEKFDIPVIKDLPVGENLQDHLSFTGFLVGLPDGLVKKSDSTDDTYDYFMHRNGPIGTVGLLNFISFINTKKNSPYPDIQILQTIYGKGNSDAIVTSANALGYEDSIKNSVIEFVKKSDVLRVDVTLAQPKSIGRVVLKSSDPFDKPEIHANYLSDDEDLKTILRGVKFLLHLFKTPAFKRHNVTILRQDISRCRSLVSEEDFYTCAIRNVASTVYHPVGTCKMGPKDDGDSVVDSKLRVHGIGNLRVIDASIMPKIVSANTNAPSIMIGERGADFIKETWN